MTLNSPTRQHLHFRLFSSAGRRLTYAAIIGTVLSLSHTTLAQPNTAPTFENWYQVDLLIFKRPQNEAAYDREHWPKNIALAYPPNVRYLHYPEAETADTEENTEGAPTTTVDDAAIATESPAIPETFTPLSKDHYLITNAEAALKREPGVKVLFHETWLQPMEALDNAPAIIVQGGGTFGDQHELSGSVTLSISRYLHIHTDLWLAEFEANYGQEDYHWPALPAAPKRLDDLSESTADATALDQTTAGGWQLNAGNGLNLGGNSDQYGLFNDFSGLTEQPFLIKQLVSMNQKRRMRSGELHYIDHPKMGILIRFEPYKPEEELSLKNVN